MRASIIPIANGVKRRKGIPVKNEEIDNFIGERVKVTLESGRVREGVLKQSDDQARILVRVFRYDVSRTAISKIERLP
jgi:small nuclear ribonucleoprotein (snRNP)-like protein